MGIEHYAAVPKVGAERLEIQFIEVAIAARGRGVGTQVVRGLAKRHRNRRLLAYSEGTGGFWAPLDWERFDHPEGRPEFHRALFIQPNPPPQPARILVPLVTADPVRKSGYF